MKLGLKHYRTFLFLQGVVSSPMCTVVMEIYGQNRDLFFLPLSLRVFIYFLKDNLAYLSSEGLSDHSFIFYMSLKSLDVSNFYNCMEIDLTAMLLEMDRRLLHHFAFLIHPR